MRPTPSDRWSPAEQTTVAFRSRGVLATCALVIASLLTAHVPLIPAQAGIQSNKRWSLRPWIPACAVRSTGALPPTSVVAAAIVSAVVRPRLV